MARITLLTVTLDEQNSLSGHYYVLRFLCANTRGQILAFAVTEQWWGGLNFREPPSSAKLLNGAGESWELYWLCRVRSNQADQDRSPEWIGREAKCVCTAQTPLLPASRCCGQC